MRHNLSLFFVILSINFLGEQLMTNKKRKALHKQIKENFKGSPTKWIDIDVYPYRPDMESDTLVWGVITYDIYERYRDCVYYSADKQQALEFAEKLDKKWNGNEDIELECRSKPVCFHCSNQLGGYYA